MRVHICKELNALRIHRLIKHEDTLYLHGHLVKEETHSPRVLTIQDWVLQDSCHRQESGHSIPRAQRTTLLARQIFPLHLGMARQYASPKIK